MIPRRGALVALGVAGLFLLATLVASIGRPGLPPECYVSALIRNEPNTVPLTLLGSAVAAPDDQPWVKDPRDCHYSLHGNRARLDPNGCYGLDQGGGRLTFRADFCDDVP